MRLTFEKETRIISTLLEKFGASKEEAAATAEVLAEGDLRGFGSHGMLRLPYILRAIKRGTIVTNANIKVVRETPATASIDGGHGLGHFVATKAMRLAIQKAKKVGIGAVGTFNSNHFGIAGYYAELAMFEDLVAIVTTTTDALVHPFGGVEPLIGTNAFAIGIPSKPPVLLDMAMSIAARGKLVKALKDGKKIPETWAIDSGGNPTTDPQAALEGALSPFGGPKGYGLALALEILAGPMVGAAAGKNVTGSLEPVEGYSTKGDLMIAINPSAFGDPDEFKNKANDYLKQLIESKKAPGFKEILPPGGPEYRTRSEQLRDGIIISEEVWAEVSRTAKEAGIDIEKLEQN